MKKLRRKPTYGAAIRLARIAAGLFSKPYGWSFKSIAEDLEISERTLARYVSVLRSELLDWHGGPLVEVVGNGGDRKLRLVSSMKAAEASSYQVALLYFSLTVLKFLEGTVLKEGVEGLWEKVFQNLSMTQQTRLSDLERKFYAVPYAPKDYTDFSEQLDVILRALLDQSRLRVDYAGLTGEGHQHDFDPYSLIAYRGGLYLLGHSHRSNATIYLAVERIRSVEFIRQPDGSSRAVRLSAQVRSGGAHRRDFRNCRRPRNESRVEDPQRTNRGVRAFAHDSSQPAFRDTAATARRS